MLTKGKKGRYLPIRNKLASSSDHNITQRLILSAMKATKNDLPVGQVVIAINIDALTCKWTSLFVQAKLGIALKIVTNNV